MTEASPSSPPSPSPAELAREGRIELLEQQWIDEMASPGDIDRYVAALRVFVAQPDEERITLLLSTLVEALQAADREDAILEVLEELADAGLRRLDGFEELTGALLRARHGAADYAEFLLARSGIEGDAVPWSSFLVFRRNTAYLPGEAVFHASGWREGVVEALDVESGELHIRFASGVERHMPWQTALDTLRPLASWDIRGLRLTDPEGLAQLAKEKPAEILRRVLRVQRGRATSTQLKEFIADVAVPTRSWATWWKKAKVAAGADPLIAVEGSPTRPTLVLRKKELTLPEEARYALQHEKRVTTLVKGLRAYFNRVTREEERTLLSAFAREQLDGIASSASPGAENIEALAYLEELGEAPLGAFDDALRRVFAIDGEGGVDLVPLASIGDQPTRSRVAGRLPFVLGEGWHELVAPRLKQIPEACEASIELLVERMREQRASEALLSVYESIAPFPGKHPFLIYLLTRAFADGDLDAPQRCADPNVICRVAMHVLRVVSEGRRSSGLYGRLQNRLSSLLTGKKNLLARLLESIDRRTMESCRTIGSRSGPDFPTNVRTAVERAARHRFPEIFSAPDRDFWEVDDSIFTTRDGLAARSREFEHLRDVKIPENSKAIGDAASLGDLSENSEWTAAIEEQRHLTQIASEMEDELRRAKLLEEVSIPVGSVAPGTRVELLDLETDAVETIRILGPWDSALGDDVVSYRAPLAKSMLGRSTGDEATIVLPGSTRHVRILEIQVLF